MKVRIKCKQVMHYDQVREIPDEEYEKIKHLDYDEVREGDEAYGVLSGYVNFEQILDSDNEFTDVTVTVSK